MAKLRIAVITDVHFGIDRGSRLGSKAPRLMEQFIKAVNNDAPDLVVDMGDRVTATNAEDDRYYMKALSKYYNRLSMPFHALIGNHDIKNLTRRENTEILGTPSSSSYSRVVNGHHLIFWNPNVIAEEGGLKLEDQHIEWLKNELAKNDKPAILFSHVPLDNDENDNAMDAETAKQYGIIAGRFYYEQGAEIRKMLEDSGKVRLCLAGHRHKNRHREINGIHYITQQSFTNTYQKYYRVPGRNFSYINVDDDGTITFALQGKGRNRPIEIPASPGTKPS